MKQICLGILIFLIIGCSDDNEVKLSNELFVGNWSTTAVISDGVIQPEWLNTRLIIEQENSMGGIYQMVNTPYDSIWSSSGQWATYNESNAFLIDDAVVVEFVRKNDNLYLSKSLPGMGIPCDFEKDSVCVLGITGEWQFRFTKE